METKCDICGRQLDKNGLCLNCDYFDDEEIEDDEANDILDIIYN